MTDAGEARILDSLRELKRDVSDVRRDMHATREEAAGTRAEVAGLRGYIEAVDERQESHRETSDARHAALERRIGELRGAADATGQQMAVTAATAKALAPRASDRPSSRSAKLQIARWHAVAAIVAALAGVATAWLVGRTGAPSTPPAQAAPKR